MNFADSCATCDVVHPQSRSESSRNLARHETIFRENRKQEREQRNEMRGIATQPLTFVQRFIDQAHFTLLQVTKPTVDQF